MAVQTNQSSRPFLGERPSVLIVRDEPESALGTHEAGIYGHIVKPFDAKDVANRIAQVLCGRCLGGEAAPDEEARLWQQRHEFMHA
jgi:DNA-binding NarL/FixJ family response regulator